MKYVRIIDEDGFFVRDDFVTELTALTVEAPCPSGFYRPKWDGKQWVEGLTQAEIDATLANQLAPSPTLEELATNLLEAQNAIMMLSIE